MDKQIQGMKNLTKDVYDGIQRLTINAGRNNVEIIAECLRNLQIVYNTLTVMEENEDERDANPE